MSGVAQDEAAAAKDDAFVGRISLTVLAAVQAALRAELEASREVPGLVARTRVLEQFVDGLKPDATDPVVRRQEQQEALRTIDANWQAGDNRFAMSWQRRKRWRRSSRPEWMSS